MNRNKLKTYAPQARRDFIQAVTDRASHFGLTEKAAEPVKVEGDIAMISGRAFPKKVADQRQGLEEQIAKVGFEQAMEAIAYTWFNRMVAIRYMELHGYLEHGYRVLSHPEGSTTPEILEHAEHVDLPGLDPQQVIDLKLDGTRESELYRMLLIAQCNALHRAMPFLFERIDDETELLLPSNLLHSDSLIRKLADQLDADDCENIEVIGWLYQFYIAEKKDDVFAALKKGKKISPKNIPAATQLFTPHWIVRYLVDNTLGRLWMVNQPDSKLVERMDFYIKPDEHETTFLKISSPEELKICDPACGSGHMLTYAFDLLYTIYEEQGYQATDIPRLILENNLYGIEIDHRAGSLAAFALTMKAREKYRRFLSKDRGVQPNICVLENIQIEPDDLTAYMDIVGRDLFSGGLQGVVNQFEEADNFGSLIRPMVTDVSEVLELLRERKMGEDLFLVGVHQKVLKTLKQADYLSPKYHVVIANPPYMGNNGMSLHLKSFLKSNYEDVRSDLFSSFIDRDLSLVLPGGHLGHVTPYVWMFLSSYEQLRSNILTNASITSLVQLEYNAFEPACIPVCVFTLCRQPDSDQNGSFIRLTEFRGHHNQAPKTLEAINDHECGWFFSASSSDFRQLPGCVIAYWATPSVIESFSLPSLGDCLTTREGMATADNDRFLRFWHEVAFETIAFGCKTETDAEESGGVWFPYNKGGVFRRWYGNNEFVVEYKERGYNIKNNTDPDTGRIRSHNYNGEFGFREGLTWSALSSGLFSIRFSPEGFLFDSKGAKGFAAKQYEILALLNSTVAQQYLSILSPTLDFKVGDVIQVPMILDALNEDADCIARECVQIAKLDWDAFETSWDFQSHPLLGCNTTSLSDAYYNVDKQRQDKVAKMSRLEDANNSHFSNSYKIGGIADSEESVSNVSLKCNLHYRYGSDKSESELEALMLADTMREFISYAVGCMLGRYSLDKSGLILGNQGETAIDYRRQIPNPTFEPDEDNVIPLLQGGWFSDDATERFKEFLRVTFGGDHFDENVKYIENALGKSLEKYMTMGFFKHHLSLYKKRPIYWLFSSGKQRAFQCLVYMHRYNEGTLSRMRTEYVIPLSGMINSRIDQLEDDIAAATSTSHGKKLTKERGTLIKQREELQEFDEKLRHYADQRAELDLDDGVKVNYGKIGDLLAEVKTVTGKKA